MAIATLLEIRGELELGGVLKVASPCATWLLGEIKEKLKDGSR